VHLGDYASEPLTDRTSQTTCNEAFSLESSMLVTALRCFLLASQKYHHSNNLRTHKYYKYQLLLMNLRDAPQCIMANMLQTKVDAQHDKLATELS